MTSRNNLFHRAKDNVFLGLDDEWLGFAADFVKKEKKKLKERRGEKFWPMMSDIRKKFQILGHTLASRVLPPKSRADDKRWRFPADVELILADPLVEKP